jgi:hypothetical protein
MIRKLRNGAAAVIAANSTAVLACVRGAGTYIPGCYIALASGLHSGRGHQIWSIAGMTARRPCEDPRHTSRLDKASIKREKRIRT